MKTATVGVVVILALGILLAPLAADAQPAAKVYRIGLLAGYPPTAKALGLTITQSMFIRADDVVQ